MSHLNKKILSGLLIGMLCLQWSCSGENKTENVEEVEEVTEVRVEKSDFGTLEDGRAVDLYTLTNENGVEVKIISYGGIVTSIRVPDKEGNVEDVVLGFESLEGYLQAGVPYFGAIVGRYGNRIADGQFTLDGETYQLAKNDGPNHLHGGLKGFDKVLWEGEAINTEEGAGVKLHYLSEDMEEGYPGNLSVDVVYMLTNDNELRIDYEATTDKPTIVNLTNHAYFNLTGDMTKDILDHQVMINADQFVPVTETLIPVGELRPVEGTPFDFTEPTAIGKRINDENEQLGFGKGYDHCWVLNDPGEELSLAATVHEPVSGRYMEVFTTEPGIQFYTGNFLDGTLKREGGGTFKHRSGFCLETEHFPDSPNQPDFPSVVLRPGDLYQTNTVYKFSVKE